MAAHQGDAPDGDQRVVLALGQAAVIVVDRALVVRVWTQQAHELWGLRADETVGHHLLNLDSGLPTGELQPWMRSVIAGQQEAIIGRQVHAVNRRGREVDLRVTVTTLHEDGDQPAGALILMEELSESDLASGSSGSAVGAES